jgi:nucleoside-diphosphate-sugar epimerase
MGNPRTSLILGVTGQDGTYLVRLLLGHRYRVVGTSRNAQKPTRVGGNGSASQRLWSSCRCRQTISAAFSK